MINSVCLTYYDTKVLIGDMDSSDLEGSLMEKLEEYLLLQNKNDSGDKVKYYWAYNLPCALLVNGGQKFWFSHLKDIYTMLNKDSLINVRTAMSAGFKEIIDLLNVQTMEKEEERKFFIDVMNQYLNDSDEISAKVLPDICHLVSKFPDTEKIELLDSLIRVKIEAIKIMKNGRDSLIKMLEQIFEMFQPSLLMEENFHEYLFEII